MALCACVIEELIILLEKQSKRKQTLLIKFVFYVFVSFFVVAQDKNRVRKVGFAKLYRTLCQDQGFPRASHTVNHAMSIAQVTGKFLLFPIHYLYQIWNG